MGKVAKIINGVMRQVDNDAAPTIYDEVYTAVGTVTSGTAVSLPSSRTYDSAELEVYFNTQRLVPVTDYNYVGSVPRTQVTFAFDLVITDKIRFRIDRNI